MVTCQVCSSPTINARLCKTHHEINNSLLLKQYELIQAEVVSMIHTQYKLYQNN